MCIQSCWHAHPCQASLLTFVKVVIRSSTVTMSAGVCVCVSEMQCSGVGWHYRWLQRLTAGSAGVVMVSQRWITNHGEGLASVWRS